MAAKHLKLAIATPWRSAASSQPLHPQPFAIALLPRHSSPAAASGNANAAASATPPMPGPPATREEAITQAKTCLAAALQKPLNSVALLGASRKLKRQPQPRFRVEVPVADTGGVASSLVQLAAELFSELKVSRKGAPPTMLLLWPSQLALEIANDLAFKPATAVKNGALGTAATKLLLSSCDIVVFLGTEESQLDEMRTVADESYPGPAVLVNPAWAFDDEPGFSASARSFVGTFNVVYSFLGLEVKGLLSRRRGVVLRSGASGSWVVMVEEEGQLREVTRFRTRPAIGDVESVLYNLMAAKSPVTKSVKFLKDLVTNAARLSKENKK